MNENKIEFYDFYNRYKGVIKIYNRYKKIMEFLGIKDKPLMDFDEINHNVLKYFGGKK